MDNINSNQIDPLLISESNYSCQFFNESFMRMKSNKTKQIYYLDEKEKDMYERQEELGKKMLELISNNQKQFKHKYNMLDKEEDLYHKEYNSFNDRIKFLLNQYENNNNYFLHGNNIQNQNITDINSIFDIFDNQWIFPKKKALNDKAFKAKCNMKSYDKKIIKTQRNNQSNLYKNKSSSKIYRNKSKTFRSSTNTLMNAFNTNNKNISNKSNVKISKTERKPGIHVNNFNKNQKNKNRAKNKSKTPRTTVASVTVNSSIYEDNKINDNNIQNLIVEPYSKDVKQNEVSQILIKPDYSKYLTRDNFYPKTFRIEPPNKERFTTDELFYETKTSFRDNRMLNDLYQRAFKRCNYQSNLYDNFNDKNKIY